MYYYFILPLVSRDLIHIYYHYFMQVYTRASVEGERILIWQRKGQVNFDDAKQWYRAMVGLIFEEIIEKYTDLGNTLLRISK